MVASYIQSAVAEVGSGPTRNDVLGDAGVDALEQSEPAPRLAAAWQEAWLLPGLSWVLVRFLHRLST